MRGSVRGDWRKPVPYRDERNRGSKAVDAVAKLSPVIGIAPAQSLGNIGIEVGKVGDRQIRVPGHPSGDPDAELAIVLREDRFARADVIQGHHVTDRVPRPDWLRALRYR